MWIMTPFGILMPALRPYDTIKDPNDERYLQVRARDKRALTYLRRHYMRETLGPTIGTPRMDYEYRAYCVHEDFAIAVSTMIEAIDYEKFKPETEIALGPKRGRRLHFLYNRIWGVIATHHDSSVLARYERRSK